MIDVIDTTCDNSAPAVITRVKTTRPFRCKIRKFVIPAGTEGQVIDYNPRTGMLMVDFGVTNFVQAIGPNNPGIDILR